MYHSSLSHALQSLLSGGFLLPSALLSHLQQTHFFGGLAGLLALHWLLPTTVTPALLVTEPALRN
jgi:hypothetical protein